MLQAIQICSSAIVVSGILDFQCCKRKKVTEKFNVLGRTNKTEKWFFIALSSCNTGKPIALMKIV